MNCQICEHARQTGSWPNSHRGTHCGLDARGPSHDCHRSWSSRAQSHCSECHRHFGSDSAGDSHRVKGVCGDPKGFDRWDTPTGAVFGGRSPEATRASLERLREGREGSVAERRATETGSVEVSS